MWNPESVVILSGRRDSHLAEEIAGIIGLPASSLADAAASKGGESQIQLGCNVRGRAVFVVQSTCDPVNNSVIELALIISACKRASARSVCAVAPYLAYGRQTRADKSNIVPVSGSDVATLLEEACVDAVLTLDLHDEQTAGFYSPRCVFANLSYVAVAARFLVRKGLRSPVVVASHATGVNRAMEFVEALRLYEGEAGMYIPADEDGVGGRVEASGGAQGGHPASPVRLTSVGRDSAPPDMLSTAGGHGVGELAGSGTGVDERRSHEAWDAPPSLAMILPVERRGIKELELTGDVAGRDAIVVLDMIDSGYTVLRTSRALMERGASKVFVFATHGLLSIEAPDRLVKAPVELIVLTNSVPNISSKLPADPRLRRKVAVLSVAPVLAHQICELADLPLPDLDPLIPTYAMHSGSSAVPTSRHPYGMAEELRGFAQKFAASDDCSLFDDDRVSVSESLTTASEYSAPY